MVVVSPHVMEFKTLLDSGFDVVDSGFWVLDSGLFVPGLMYTVHWKSISVMK